MIRKLVITITVFAFAVVAAIESVAAEKLIETASSKSQWTGVAVSKTGRVFVNFPRWSPNVPVSAGELADDGTVTPYPDDAINGWTFGEDPSDKFVCVQSVVVDAQDRLWILDPANPMFGGVVDGGPKLIRVDLKTNTLAKTYRFGSDVAPKASYLNDVRVDTDSESAYITDSGMGAIVVLDLKTGEARRVLDDHPSTKAENITPVIGGNPFPAKVHSDGIAFDPEERWVYFQALTGRTLYRVSADALLDTALAPGELAETVEQVAEGGVSDGLLFAHGGVYISALEKDAILFVQPDGAVREIVTDPRILWPDSFALGPDGSVWFTTSQIHLGPNPPGPYRIFKILDD